MYKEEFKRYETLYRKALLNDIIPFWMKYSPDRLNGGYFHCLDFDGSVIDTDKYMWPQTREIWTFSMLYNNLEERPEWLDMAKCGIDFLKKYGRDIKGNWYFALTKEGKPVIQPYNIFSDCFAVIAFSEFAKASGDEECMDIAVKTYDNIQERKNNPKGKYNKVIAENRNLKSLAMPMININISTVMNSIKPDPKYDKIIGESIEEIMTQFVDSEHRIIYENITIDGQFVDSYEGRHINPGHGIEAMWFIMLAAREKGDEATVKKACEITKWCMEFGWDKEYNGIYYFMDKDGKPHIELQWDMKLWWPHLEALIALLLGYKLTGDIELYQRFKKVHDYTWAHFPDKEYGEWWGYLNRYGEVNNRCKANRWKGCFHLPRALYLISEIFRELQNKYQMFTSTKEGGSR